MKTVNGIMTIEVEFQFTETHKAMPAQIDSQGQGICPPAPPEWELDSFCIGGIEVTRKWCPDEELIKRIEDKIEMHIGENYAELIK